MMSVTAKDLYKDRKLSVEEYFLLEEELDQKFEYVNGEVFNMTGGTVNHGRISTNVIGTLYQLLNGTPCSVFNSDVRLQLDHATNYFYPDAMVLCEQGKIEKKYVQHPQIIIEVLSPSTEDYDHGKKFDFYRQIKALQTYILLHQDKPLAKVFQRNANNSWLLTEYTSLEDRLPVYAELSLLMADLYRQVDFER